MDEYIRKKDASSAITLALSCDDPFQLLGIPLGLVDASQVKRNYRMISVLIHPDRCHVHGAEDAFKKIGTAKVSRFLHTW